MPWKGLLIPNTEGQVTPVEREEEIFAVLDDVQSGLGDRVTEIFGRFEAPLSPEAERIWHSSLWAARADITYERLSHLLLEEKPHNDLFMVYFGGTDTFTHRFWRFFEPEKFPIESSADDIQNFGNIVNDYYRYTDEVIGKLVAQVGSDTRIIIVSDHGMHPTREIKLDKPGKLPGYVDHNDAPPGVIIAAGPDIVVMPTSLERVSKLRLEDLESLGSILDITPTLLALMGLPVAADMDGEVATALIEKAFLADFPTLERATYEDLSWLAARDRARSDVSDASRKDQDERLEQLRALGYLESD